MSDNKENTGNEKQSNIQQAPGKSQEACKDPAHNHSSDKHKAAEHSGSSADACKTDGAPSTK